jgi:hypothetical protein
VFAIKRRAGFARLTTSRPRAGSVVAERGRSDMTPQQADQIIKLLNSINNGQHFWANFILTGTIIVLLSLIHDGLIKK